MDNTLKAVVAAARYNCDAAANPPDGFPPFLAAAVAAGTYTAMAVMAAALADAAGVDYDIMLEEFGLDPNKAPPKDDIMSVLPGILKQHAERAEVH